MNKSTYGRKIRVGEYRRHFDVIIGLFKAPAVVDIFRADTLKYNLTRLFFSFNVSTQR